MTAQPGPPRPTDAQLVTAVLAADREALALVYDRYGLELYDFAWSMLHHREEAADVVVASFVVFAERLDDLDDPDRLRPWLSAIVRGECLRRLQARTQVARGDEGQPVATADEGRRAREWSRQARPPVVASTPEDAAERTAAALDLRERVLGATRLAAEKAHDDYEWVDSSRASTGRPRWDGRGTALVAALLLVLAVTASVLFRPDDDPPPALTDTRTTPPASADPLPARLIASTASIDLGRTRSRAAFGLVNTGERSALYQVSSRTRWLVVGPIGGTLGGGNQRAVGIVADRSLVHEGRSTGRIVVTWDGGSVTVKVTLDEERPPG